MDGGAWWAVVHGVANSQARLGDQHLHTYIVVQCIIPIWAHDLDVPALNQLLKAVLSL